MFGLISRILLTIGVFCPVGSSMQDTNNCKSFWLCNNPNPSIFDCVGGSDNPLKPGGHFTETINEIRLSGNSNQTFPCLKYLKQEYPNMNLEVFKIHFNSLDYNTRTSDGLFVSDNVNNGDLDSFPHLNEFFFGSFPAKFYGDDIFRANDMLRKIRFEFKSRYTAPYPNFLLPKKGDPTGRLLFPNLRSLYLKNWLFEGHIPQNAFSDFENLISLTMIACISREDHINSLLNLTSLQYLKLSESKILTFLPKDFLKLTQYEHHDIIDSMLITLRLENNALAQIHPGAFKYLYNLQNVYLDGNPLQLLSSETFRHLYQLRNVSIRDCHFIHIDGFFTATRQTVIFHQYVLQKVPRNVNCKLREFLAMNNKISQLTRNTFFNLPILEAIDLSYNKIITIESGTFKVLPGLRLLNLSHNEIKISDFSVDAFQCVQNLEILDLRFNILSSFLNFSELNRPSSIDICKNEPNFRLVKASYFGNPFTCDCEMYSIYISVYRNPINVRAIDLSDTQCTFSFPEFSPFSSSVMHTDDYVGKETNNCPSNCQCFRHCSKGDIYAICERVNLTSIPQDFPDTLVTLKLSQNQIMLLNKSSFPNQSNIAVLDLSRNKISDIAPDTFHGLVNLQFLNLSSNQIQYLRNQMFTYDLDKFTSKFASYIHQMSITPQYIRQSDNVMTIKQLIQIEIFWKNIRFGLVRHLTDLSMLQIFDNPLECSCLMQWFIETDKVSSKYTLKCNKNLNEYDLLLWIKNNCVEKRSTYIIITLVSLLIFVSSTATVFINRRNISVVIFHKTGVRINWILGRNKEDWSKKYDGFISYSKKDEHFVLKDLLPYLEKHYAGFRICIHERDFVPGNPIIENIERSISQSRRTIIILSSNFIESEWCKTEFKMAHYKVLAEKNRVILIALEDVGNLQKKLDKEIKAYMSLNTFLNRKDVLFWQKLIVAMPNWKNNPSKTYFAETANHVTYGESEARESEPLITLEN